MLTKDEIERLQQINLALIFFHMDLKEEDSPGWMIDKCEQIRNKLLGAFPKIQELGINCSLCKKKLEESDFSYK